MNLGEKVSVTLEITGEIVGRTFEGDPKVDLKLPWGMLNGIPLSVLKRREPDAEDAPNQPEHATADHATAKHATAEHATAEHATNVTQIRQAARKNRKVAAAG